MYSDIVWTGRYRYKCVFWNIHMIRELQAGQQQIVDMLRAFDKIARKHNVTYFLTAGTLIGGMRRGGIIPWDGDGDVGILEEDYHRLKLVLHKELPRGMYFQTPCRLQHLCDVRTVRRVGGAAGSVCLQGRGRC